MKNISENEFLNFYLLNVDISVNMHGLYGGCGSRNSRPFTHRVTIFTANSDRQCWSCFSIGLYGSKTNFSLPFIKYSF